MAFWTSTASLLMLLLTVRYGTIAAAGFIGLWASYFLAWPKFSADALLRTFLPWTFPLFAIASATWSIAPDLSVRNGVEWLATAAIGVLMASSMPIEKTLASWMLALIPVVILGGLLGGSQFTEAGQVAATGFFGSKNNFALHISEMSLICIAVLASGKQSGTLRVIALFGGIAGPLLLWKARSVGALAVFLPSLLLMLGIIGIGRMRQHLRGIAVAGSLAVAMVTAAAVLPTAIESRDALLSSVGKSGDLTGRGLLWQRATVLIEQRPALGVGFAAFWWQGNPEAEALWRAEHIASRGGFHFHNFYYEALVELGYTGLAVGLTVVGLTTAAVLTFGVRRPGPESGFFCAMMLFLFLRSFVELDFLGGFGLNALILPVAWIYARSRARSGVHWISRLDAIEPQRAE